jgi:hypothetical protein
MKHAVALLLLVSSSANANESYCYSIQNADKKNFCLGVVKNQESYCYSIQESDTKNMCRAQVKRQSSYCYSIDSSDTMNFCLATQSKRKIILRKNYPAISAQSNCFRARDDVVRN